MLGEHKKDQHTRVIYRGEDANYLDNAGSTVALINSGSVAFVQGKLNKCADFGTGFNKYLAKTNHNIFSGVNIPNLTVQFWVKMRTAPSSGNFAGIFSLNVVGSPGLGIQFYYENNSGTLRLGATNLATGVGSGTYNVDLGTTAWHHIALVRENSLTLRVYLDGVLVLTLTGTGASTYWGDQDSRMIINAFRGANSPAACYIDELKVDERVWTAKQINNYINLTKGKWD